MYPKMCMYIERCDPMKPEEVDGVILIRGSTRSGPGKGLRLPNGDW